MTGSTNTPTGIQLAPGTLLADRYKILRRIGGGGMGSVYLAEDQNLANRLVAVKEMVEMFADESARGKAIDDFKREAELLAGLDLAAEVAGICVSAHAVFPSRNANQFFVASAIDSGFHTGACLQSIVTLSAPGRPSAP